MRDPDQDVIVIGAGPAGYCAAIRAAQLGLSVACVDDREGAGGTCLNVGCIPSKALLSSTERLARARTEWSAHGIEVGEIDVDLSAMMGRKRSVVETLTRGVDGLLEKNGVVRHTGRGELLGGGRVRVTGEEDAERTLVARHVVLATGSRATLLPDVDADEERILTSEGAMALSEVPEHLLVVGGGYVGLELGSVWRRLGAEVTVLEADERVLPSADPEIAEALARHLDRQGLEVHLGCAVEALRRDGHHVVVRIAEAGSQESRELEGSHALIAIGREPLTEGLGLAAAGVAVLDDGAVRTDARFRTSAPGVYAVGDLVGEPMLAHKGMLEASACAEVIAGRGAGHVDYDAVPSVVYTWPEVASMGRDEHELRDAEVAYRTGRASFEHDPRALCTGDATGFVKLLVEDGSDRLLGAHVIGPHAGSLIHELVVTTSLRGAVEELGDAPHAHPTLNEALREAALDAEGRAIHR